LDIDDREELKQMKNEIAVLTKEISEEDRLWIDTKISEWYSRYLEVEVNTRMRLTEG